LAVKDPRSLASNLAASDSKFERMHEDCRVPFRHVAAGMTAVVKQMKNKAIVPLNVNQPAQLVINS
jgi:hypothetical protein